MKISATAILILAISTLVICEESIGLLDAASVPASGFERSPTLFNDFGIANQELETNSSKLHRPFEATHTSMEFRQADIGLALIVPIGLTMLFALIPIIGIEAGVLWSRLSLSFVTALIASAWSNAVSTIIGIPLTWFLMGFLAIFVPISEPDRPWKKLILMVKENIFWISPANQKEYRSLVPLAALVLLVPCFFVTYAIEAVLIEGIVTGVTRQEIASAVFTGNLVTYLLLALLPLCSLVISRDQLAASVMATAGRAIRYLGLTPDGVLVAGGSRGSIRMFDAKSGSQTRLIRKGFRATDMTMSRDGEYLGLGRLYYDEGEIEVRERKTRKRLTRLDLFDSVFSFAFSPEGSLLAAAGWSGLQLWNWRTGEEIELEQELMSSFECTAFSPNGEHLAANHWETIHLWDLTTTKLVLTMDGHGLVSAITFSPDGKYLAVSDGDTVYYRHSVSGELVRMFEGGAEEMPSLCMSPAGQLLVSGGSDGAVYIWRTQTGTLLLSSKISAQRIHSILFSPDGGCLYAADLDHIYRWRIESEYNLETPCWLTRNGWEEIPDSPSGSDSFILTLLG